jgi:hypothetical protein
MSSTLLALALYLIAAAPLAIAARKRAWVGGIAGIYAVGILLVVGFQIGVRHEPEYVARAERPAIQADGQCAQAIDLLTANHVILDRSDPSRPVVDREIWRQLPPSVRDAVTTCLDRARPAGEGGDAVHVVLQGAQ